MPDQIEETISVIDEVKAKMRLEAEATRRYNMGAPGAFRRAVRYRRYLKYYSPINNDQWPEDLYLRPSKVHVTANMIRSYVDIIARLLSIQPRLINKPTASGKEARRQAESIEQLYYRMLDQSGWDVWLNEHAQNGEIYGLSVLKPFWNKDTDAPDVMVLAQPQNLILGYGSNDYSVIDWSIYRYTISFIEAASRWPQLSLGIGKGNKPTINGTPVSWASADKADIVNQKGAGNNDTLGGNNLTGEVPNSDHMETYEQQEHLEVWDYWYREGGQIVNAVLLAGQVVDGPHIHSELPTIPYLINESGHEPGSPEGLSTVELLIDTQMGYNRTLSLWTQHTLDNSGTAYQVTGPTAGDMPEGVVPKSDEFIPVGENEIKPIQRNQNNYPAEQLVKHYWELASRLTGIPEILFGQLAGAQTSGRATAVQIEAALNRLDPKRRRFYANLKELLRVWGYMLSYKDKQVEIVVPVEQADPNQPQLQAPQFQIQKVGMKELLKGFDNWKISAPEITPRDNMEATQNAANKVQAHLSSIETAMDEIGIDDPQHEMDLIRAELADARLNPGQVQAYISSMQLMMQLMQMQQQQPDPNAAGDQGQNVQQAQDQQAQPQGLQDQNQPGMPTGPGGAPPPGTNPPGGMGLQLQGLIRQKGGTATPMNQVVLPPVRG